MHDAITVCPWLDDKRWAYSITFDEGLSDLHRFSVPILEEFGVPGHAEVVVGQLGQVRRIGQSSYNGFRHMGPGELRDLLARGWGVGNHTWSHELVTPETVEREIGEAKQVLEDAIGEPVTVYCAAGDNSNMSPHVLDACRRHGYLGAMSITDALNRPDDADLLWINRTFLHTQGYAPFYSEFDPFRNIAHARRDRGWLIDYLHCPLEKAVHPNKDCSAAELRERVETVCGEGGADVWLARVEDVVDYRYTRRAVRVTVSHDGEYAVAAADLHPSVRSRVVTLSLPKGTYAASIDGKAAAINRRGGRLLLNLDLARPVKLRLRGGSPAPAPLSPRERGPERRSRGRGGG